MEVITLAPCLFHTTAAKTGYGNMMPTADWPHSRRVLENRSGRACTLSQGKADTGNKILFVWICEKSKPNMQRGDKKPVDIYVLWFLSRVHSASVLPTSNMLCGFSKICWDPVLWHC